MRYSIILFTLMVAGCGQKGALYLPSEKPQASVPVDSRVFVSPDNAQGNA